MSVIANSLKKGFSKIVGDDTVLKPAITDTDRDKLYQSMPSFVGHLPWVEYSHTDSCYKFEDGISVAAGYQLTPFDADGRSGDFMLNRRVGMLNALHSIPDNSESPWVLQTYIQGAPLTVLKDSIRNGVHDRAKGTKVSEDFLVDMMEHIDQVSAPGGIFDDKGSNWRGKCNSSRMFLYRRSKKSDFPKRGMKRPEDELKSVTKAFEQQMKFAKMEFKRTDSADLYDWMLPFFNPQSTKEAGGQESLVRSNPYPLQEEKDGDLPLGFDLATSCFMSSPKSVDEEHGVYEFQRHFYKYITLGPLPLNPKAGHLTLPLDNEKPALFDLMPDDTMISMTITINNQLELRKKTVQLADGKTGEDEQAKQAKSQSISANHLLNHGHRGYKLNMGVYVRAASLDQLMVNVDDVVQTLRTLKLNPIDADDDLLSQNNFVTQMPMAYEPGRVQKDYSSNLTYTHHIVNLMPIWGRGRGTGNPGFVYFNRSAEPLTFDPFNKKDRRRAAHGLILGPTGSGKSAAICYHVEMWMAMFRPRVFIVESGNSFGLLGDHLKSKDVSVNHVRISVGDESSGLSPFADAVKLLDGVDIKLDDYSSVRELERAIASIYGESDIKDYGVADAPNEDDDGDDDERDLIGEMELAAMLMITGGEDEEMKNYERADRNMVRTAIFLASYNVKKAFADKVRTHNQVLPTDISEALLHISKDQGLHDQRRLRAEKMYESLNLFNQGLEAKFFNRPGKPWELADVTIVDLDRFARKGSEDKLAVLMTGLLNRINDIAEASQHDGRPIIVIIDEAHVVTINPLLGPYIAMIGKMWRKLKTWLWLATQNMKDFPDQASKMLSMAEFWICLNPDDAEIAEIARFRNLTEDQISLLREATKVPQKYVEGVVISEVLTTLFRNVPPARSLALAGTEGDEKEARKKLMDDLDIDELTAIDHIKNDIFQAREQHRKGFM